MQKLQLGNSALGYLPLHKEMLSIQNSFQNFFIMSGEQAGSCPSADHPPAPRARRVLQGLACELQSPPACVLLVHPRVSEWEAALLPGSLLTRARLLAPGLGDEQA